MKFLRNCGLPVFMLALAAPLSGNPPESEEQQQVERRSYLRFVKSADPDCLDPDKVLASWQPAYAIRVLEVDPKGQGHEAGIQPGWLFHRLNGTPIWHFHQRLISELLDQPDRKAEFLTTEGENVTITLKPGLIGILQENFSRPEIFIMETVPKGRWSRHLLAAHLALDESRYELAGFALDLAMKAGMKPNPIATYLELMLSLEKGEMSEARQLTTALLKELPPDEIPRYYQEGLTTAALALGDWVLLKRCVLSGPEHYDESGLTLPPDLSKLADWAKVPLSQPQELLELARKTGGPNRIGDIVDFYRDPEQRGDDTSAAFLRSGSFDADVPTGRFHHWHFTLPEGMQDVVFSFDAWVGPSGPPAERWPNSFAVKMVSSDKEPADGRESWTMTHNRASVISMIALDPRPPLGRTVHFVADLSPGQWKTIHHFPWLETDDVKKLRDVIRGKPDQFTTGKAPLHIDLIRKDGHTAVYMNGSPYARFPLTHEIGNTNIILTTVGCVYRIKNIELREL